MSAAGLALSAPCTLIVPVPLSSLGEVAAAAAISLGDIAMVRKKEHHLTVFGFPIGKALKKACAADASLRGDIDAVIAASDWTLRVGQALLVHLDRESERGHLHTVIVLAEAELGGFFARIRTLALERAPEQPDLHRLLESAPPPHVTLYTSDPTGAAGIGLTSEAELAAALARGESGEAGLRARRIEAGDLAVAAS